MKAFKRRSNSVIVNDGRMTLGADASTIAEAVNTFFAEHEVASLRLPSGWFGRPHDNWHHLTEASALGDRVVIRLDDRQVLTLDAKGVSAEDRVLRVSIRGGRWHWTEYGGDTEHREGLKAGPVEFHAPFHQ